jgi:hypothetical protein
MTQQGRRVARSEIPRHAISIAIAIAAVAGLELVESRITRASNATFRP